MNSNTQRTWQNTVKKMNDFLPWPLWFFPLVVFLPVFIHEFAMQNDYGLLLGYKIYPEAPYLVVTGRILNAYASILQGWCFHNFSELAGSRFLSFLVMLLFSAVFYRFLSARLKVEGFWATLIVLGMMMLPSSQIYIIWVAQIFPGYLALLLAMISYRTWYSATRPDSGRMPDGIFRRILSLALAMGLFLASAFTYSANAMFVFVCIFSGIIFSSLPDWPRTCRNACRDLVFYVGLMALYAGIHLYVVLPHAPAWVGNYSIQSPIYQFRLATNFFAKVALLGETVIVALGGIWHSVVGKAGAAIPGTILVLSAALILFVRGKDLGKNLLRKKTALYPFQAILLGSVLFLWANAPTFVAKEVGKVLGYRVLFPAATFFLLLQFGLLQRCEEVLSKRKKIFWLRFFAAVLVAANILIAAKDVRDMVRNFCRELTFVREKVSAINFADYSNIALVTLTPEQGETLIEHKLPYEMSFMITLSGLINPVINEVAQARGVAPIPATDTGGKIIFSDPYTYVIDLHNARLGAQPKDAFRSGQLVSGQVSTSAGAGRRVEIIREGNQFFVFREKAGSGYIPFWPVDFKNSQPSWLQIDFSDQAQELKMFTFAVYLPQANLAAPVACRLQGSQDGKSWVDLPTSVVFREKADPHFKVCRVEASGIFQRYRFYLVPEFPWDNAGISKIHMILWI